MKAYSISVMGASHEISGMPCQDCSGFFTASEYAAIAVSDGHGGDKYFRSDKGAKTAVEAALTQIRKCLDEKNSEGKSKFLCDFLSPEASDKSKAALIERLLESIVRYWNDEVSKELSRNPFTEAELEPLDQHTRGKMLNINSDYGYKAYGATLTAAVVFDGFWFGFQIGDGTFVLKTKEGYSQPIELDECCVGTYVTSICDTDAIKLFHHAFGYEMPDAVLIASDGVDESFASVSGLYKFYDNVINNSLEDWEQNLSELKSYLPKLSKKGSKDDMSLAWIVSEGCKG